jgi:hypothetical protein
MCCPRAVCCIWSPCNINLECTERTESLQPTHTDLPLSRLWWLRAVLSQLTSARGRAERGRGDPNPIPQWSPSAARILNWSSVPTLMVLVLASAWKFLQYHLYRTLRPVVRCDHSHPPSCPPGEVLAGKTTSSFAVRLQINSLTYHQIPCEARGSRVYCVRITPSRNPSRQRLASSGLWSTPWYVIFTQAPLALPDLLASVTSHAFVIRKTSRSGPRS